MLRKVCPIDIPKEVCPISIARPERLVISSKYVHPELLNMSHEISRKYIGQSLESWIDNPQGLTALC